MPPIAQIASACSDCKCVKTLDVNQMEGNGYCCFNNEVSLNIKSMVSKENSVNNNIDLGAMYEWKTNPWGNDKPCGVGEQRRFIECIKISNNGDGIMKPSIMIFV